MKNLPTFLAGTVLSAGLLLSPAFAQTPEVDDTSPDEEVAAGEAPADGEAPATEGETAETAPPNAPDQEPAFPEQTRALLPDEPAEVSVETFAEELPHLWSIQFLPDGRILAAAKSGVFHIISEDGEAGPAIDGLPQVDDRDQGGLLDIALSPDFETSNLVYFSFAEPRDDGNGTSVGRARLALGEDGEASVEDVEIIFQQTPSYDGTMHFGSRLVFDGDGHLFIAVGERSDATVRDQAQDLSSGLGKVFRIDPQTGEAVEDNPFVDEEDAQPEIWSYGHRNIQSATLDGEGRLWTVEHGPRGGDELNRPEAGLNYGWPVITYGIEYRGDPVGEGVTEEDGMEQPVYYWDPSPAASGMAFYDGEEFPEWENAFLVGGLVTTGIIVLHMDWDNDLVAFEERIPLDARIRDVRVGPDGAVYAVTENREESTSTILRLTRAD